MSDALSIKQLYAVMFAKPIEEIRKRWQEAAKTGWSGHINYPFSGYLDKPRASLSKHDEDPKRGGHHWHVDDVVFLANAREDMGNLLDFVGKSVPLVAEMLKKIDDLEVHNDGLLIPKDQVTDFLRWTTQAEELLNKLGVRDVVLAKKA